MKFVEAVVKETLDTNQGWWIHPEDGKLLLRDKHIRVFSKLQTQSGLPLGELIKGGRDVLPAIPIDVKSHLLRCLWHSIAAHVDSLPKALKRQDSFWACWIMYHGLMDVLWIVATLNDLWLPGCRGYASWIAEMPMSPDKAEKDFYTVLNHADLGERAEAYYRLLNATRSLLVRHIESLTDAQLSLSEGLRLLEQNKRRVPQRWERLVERVLSVYFQHPDTRCMAVWGSLGRGHADQWTEDVDLLLFVDKPLSKEVRRAMAEALHDGSGSLELIDAEDFKVDCFYIEGIYFTVYLHTVHGVEQAFERLQKTVGARGYMAEYFLKDRPLRDSYGDFARWRERAKRCVSEIRPQTIRRLWRWLEEQITALKQHADQGDDLCFAQHLTAASGLLLEVLFWLNGSMFYSDYFKWIGKEAKNLPSQPDRTVERVQTAYVGMANRTLLDRYEVFWEVVSDVHRWLKDSGCSVA